jgi:hypothetical protein
MSKRSKRNKGRVQALGWRQEREQREQVTLARQVWLGKRVVLDMGQDGSLPGQVSEITDEGLVCVEGVPGTGGVILSLGYLHLLTLAE